MFEGKICFILYSSVFVLICVIILTFNSNYSIFLILSDCHVHRNCTTDVIDLYTNFINTVCEKCN